MFQWFREYKTKLKKIMFGKMNYIEYIWTKTKLNLKCESKKKIKNWGGWGCLSHPWNRLEVAKPPLKRARGVVWLTLSYFLFFWVGLNIFVFGWKMLSSDKMTPKQVLKNKKNKIK
jgi:hypothetical protein